jgi:class 3 adenylate cyclase
MCRFAHECLLEMDRLLVHKLVPAHGEATGNLKLRVGLNSGSVTAGVLRGDRARFQLFGDTVNTAARMENTGIPGKIQVSADTAKLIIDAGKQEWLKPREGGVEEAKGKGIMQTSWCVPRTTESRSSCSGSTTHSGDDSDSDDEN